MLRPLLHDESGFVISAELVLVATLLVIGLIVGLSEVQHSVVAELNDVADAIGEVNQSYSYSGFHKVDFNQRLHAVSYGSDFADLVDDCDRNQCDIACDAPIDELPKCDSGFIGGYQGGVIVTGQGSAAVSGGAVGVGGQAAAVQGGAASASSQATAAGGTVIIAPTGAAAQSGSVIIEGPTPTPCEGGAVPCEGTLPAAPTQVIPAPTASSPCPDCPTLVPQQ